LNAVLHKIENVQNRLPGSPTAVRKIGAQVELEWADRNVRASILNSRLLYR